MFFVGSTVASISLFVISLSRQNFIAILVAIESFLLAVAIISVSFSFALDVFEAQTFSIFTLSFAAAESALGLALLVQFYRAKGRIDYNFNTDLKG